MHMVIGFLLASLIRKKNRHRAGLPSVRGKLETVHALPGRLRFNAPLLQGLSDRSHQKIGAEVEKVDGIKSVKIDPHTGSLLIQYDPLVIQAVIVHAVVVKVLGLEKELESSPVGVLSQELDLIESSLNQQIYQSSQGLMDLRSSLLLSMLSLALYRITVQGDRTLPGGIHLLWWAYVLSKRGK